MFKLNPAPTFKATVDVSQPGDAPSLQLEVVFRHRGRAELVALMDDIASSKESGKTDAEALGQIIESWVDVVDDRQVVAHLINIAVLIDQAMD